MKNIDFLALTAPGVAQLQPYLPGKPIEELERELGISNIIKLASNENPLGPGQLAQNAICEHLNTLGLYPDGSGYRLKQALAEQLGVESQQITLGNGSNEILELVARTFVTPANEVVFSAHAFAVYPIVTQAVGAKAVITAAKNWGHDLTAMQQAITERTRIVFIANPNNPTGTWLTKTELQAFLDRIPAHVLVIMDEAYFEFVDAQDYPNGIAWLAQYPNLIVTRTFSKIHGLAGLRIGYSVSQPAVADLLNRVRQPFNINSLALAAAEAALQDKAHVAKSQSVNKSGLQQLTEGFKKLGLAYIPSVGNFVCVELTRPAGEVYNALLREGVIVRPVANYGMPRHLRVTVGLEHENQRFLSVLQKILAS